MRKIKLLAMLAALVCVVSTKADTYTLTLASDDASKGRAEVVTTTPDPVIQTLTVYDAVITDTWMYMAKCPANIYSFDNYTRSQYVIPAADLSSMNGSNITALKYYTTQSFTWTSKTNTKAYIKEVNYTTMSAFEAVDGCTQVYTGLLYIVDGELSITFDEPFSYHGGNLLIGIDNLEYNYNGARTGTYFVGTQVTNASRYETNWSSYASLGNTGTANDFIPKTTFTYAEPQPVVYPDGVTDNYDGTYTVEAGSVVPIKAVSNDGYALADWDEDHNTSIRRSVTVNSDMTLTASFTTATAKVDEDGYTSFANALAAWEDGTTLTMLANAEITSTIALNNAGTRTLDLNGYGIRYNYAYANATIFQVTGNTDLTITDSNTGSQTHKFTVEPTNYSGFYATLDEANGNYSITGGYITGGNGKTYDAGNGIYSGGAIVVEEYGASVTLAGGTIIGNMATDDGGAVLINNGGSFTMTGGAIQYNKAFNNGGGIMLTNNYRTLGDGSHASTLNLYGGEISYNNAKQSDGGGIATNRDATYAIDFNMQGSPVVLNNNSGMDCDKTNNVSLTPYYDALSQYQQLKIDITDDLGSSTHQVGVHAASWNGSNIIFTDGLNGNGSYDYFVNDNIFWQVESYYNEAAFVFHKVQLEVSNPTAASAETYDTNSHAMLNGEASVMPNDRNAVVKYQYRFRKKNKNTNEWESWGDWSTWYTYENLPKGTNAGEYQVRAKAFADEDDNDYSDSNNSGEVTFTINKGANYFTLHPTAKEGLVYTGNPQELVNAGSVAHGQMQYSIAGVVNLHPEIPTATEARTYQVNYFMDGGDNYESDFSQSWYVYVTIYPLSVSENDNNINDFFSPWIGNTIPLRIERTLLKNGYFNTLCLPFDLSASEIAACELAGCELFVFVEAEMENDEITGEPQLRQVITPATSISAGVPYLIRWQASGTNITELIFSSVTIQNEMGDGVDPSAIPTDGVQFLGFVPRTHINYVETNHNYLFLGQNNTLVWPESDDDGTMKGFRAYFYIPTGTTINNAPVYHGMSARLVIRENAPTGVEYVSQEPMANSQKLIKDGILYIICGERIYNAQGQVVK